MHFQVGFSSFCIFWYLCRILLCNLSILLFLAMTVLVLMPFFMVGTDDIYNLLVLTNLLRFLMCYWPVVMLL
ncbi:hypothetical protein C2G38_2126472 [Gigaspora rosea]|uniref:Uncharacterized protein n=1 Tax=Gigaspora rosea TaxID=44941 RepID=A0A397TWX4_9GLOM|nr:hypothetical protein C2G38_2126472 [Gigaspora rosea]